jgi:uncharacterized protein YycO
MVYSYEFDGLPVQTGDILCTSDGNSRVLPGLLWRVFGALVPGPIDHVAIYVGPGGQCVESGPAGVTAFEAFGNSWDSQQMMKQRTLLTDTLYGVAYPLASRGLSPSVEETIREDVGRYCLEQAASRRPYNFNFFNSRKESAFYCTQLPYQAYLRNGIDLNGPRHVFGLKRRDNLILPREIWDACIHQRIER